MENSLPIKTKIAAWILRITGILYMLFPIVTIFLITGDPDPTVFLNFIWAIIIGLAGFLFFFFNAHYLFKRKIKVWENIIAFFSIIILWITVIFIFLLPGIAEEISKTEGYFDFLYKDVSFRDIVVPFYLFLPLCSILVSDILLILDRKNFFKVAK